MEGKFQKAGLWGQLEGCFLGEDKGSSGRCILGWNYKVEGLN